MLPPEVVGRITHFAIQIATKAKASKDARYRATGAIVAAAESAIATLEASHPAGSPVWNEFVDLLRDPDRALALIENLVEQRSLDVSPQLKPFVEEFGSLFIREVIETSSQGLDLQAVLVAIGKLRNEIRTITSPDPLTDVPWYRRPGAPRFQISPGCESVREDPRKVRLNVTMTLIGGTEPGDVHASWEVGQRGEERLTLMDENGPKRKWSSKYFTFDELDGDSYETHLRIRFVTHTGEHGFHWHFPLVRHEKGHWLHQTHLGSTVNQPDPF